VIAPPTWNDVLPTVILEALAAGRPVLGTAVGGIPYLLGADQPTGPAGWLVPPEAAALSAALPVARAEAAGRAAAARDRYLRFFHPDVLTARLVEIYAGLPANSDHSPR
jgi:glycosyltransferase involved in cell wall biosynthesis